MADYLGSVLKSEVLKRTGTFDTFSSYGVSLNSPLASNIVNVGKNLVRSYLDIRNSGTSQLFGNDIGMVTGDGVQLDDKYRVTIISQRAQKSIRAYLQEKTNIRVQSNWQEFIPFQSTGWAANLERVAAGVGMSLAQNKMFSRRMWMGTKPIAMRLTLKFQALSDARKEVLEPCLTLLKIASPGKGNKAIQAAADALNGLGAKASGGLSQSLLAGPSGLAALAAKGTSQLLEGVNEQMMTPPGPSPMFPDSSEYGDIISIYIGTTMKFTPVILSVAEIELDTRMDRGGVPISAVAIVDFETYAVQTKEDLDVVFTSTAAADANVAGRSFATAVNNVMQIAGGRLG